MNTTGRNRRLEELLNDLLNVDASERAELLDRLSADDAILRAELEERLAAADESSRNPSLSAQQGTDLDPRGLDDDRQTLVDTFGAPLHTGETKNIHNGACRWGHQSFPAATEQQPLPPALAVLRRGARFSHYELIRELGRGGMGTVYLARDTRLDRRVAIKFVHSDDTSLAERFMAEARATARCKHDHIVTVHDVGAEQGYCYMVLEYLEGETLRTWLTERWESHRLSDGLSNVEGTLAPRQPAHRTSSTSTGVTPVEAVEIIMPVVRALDSAHAQGMVHRDLKPENIMLTTDGATKVLDFGLAKVFDEFAVSRSSSEEFMTLWRTHGFATHTGTVVGTMPYMSPEQWGADDIDTRTDIWAVGIMLWEIIVGHHPLDPLSYARLQSVKDLDLPMPSLAEKRPDLGEVGAIVDRCLHKRKEARMPSAEALRAALESLDELLQALPKARRKRGVRLTPAAANLAVAPTRLGSTGDSANSATQLDAEQRPLTIMRGVLEFATLETTPEEQLKHLRRIHEVCDRVVTRLGGFIEDHTVDGFRVIFGYPMASEHGAMRAVMAGIQILDELRSAAAAHELVPLPKIAVQHRLALISPIGRTAKVVGGRELLHTMLDVSPAGTVVIDRATLDVVGGYFQTRPLPNSDDAVLVVARNQARTRLEVQQQAPLSPLIGRRIQLEMLIECWNRAACGSGSVALVVGEAGIGKTRLLNEFRIRVAQTLAVRAEWRCSPYHTQSAFHPIIENVRRSLKLEEFHDQATQQTTLRAALKRVKLDDENTISALAVLLSINRQAPEFTPSRLRELQISSIGSWIVALSKQYPILCAIEDLHWADPSTIDLLGHLCDIVATNRILLVCTWRPEFTPPWPRRSYFVNVDLPSLSLSEAEILVDALPGGSDLNAKAKEQLIQRSDGIPLHIEELIKVYKEYYTEGDEEYAFEERCEIPRALHELLAARLDRLGKARTAACAAAVLGRRFDLDNLAAILDVNGDEAAELVAPLVDAEFVYPTDLLGGSQAYLFKHALLRDAALQTLPESMRRTYHYKVAEHLVATQADRVAAQPEIVALHFARAGESERALPFWCRASRRALQNLAIGESLQHIEQGLASTSLAPETPDTLRARLELLQAKGMALTAARGYSSLAAESTYLEARMLSRQLDDPEEFAAILYGLWRYHLVRGELSSAFRLGQELLEATETGTGSHLKPAANRALCTTLFFLGRYDEAVTHAEAGIAAYDGSKAWTSGLIYLSDPKVTCLSYLGLALWKQGHRRAGMQRGRAAEELSRQLGHSHTRVNALHLLAWLQQFSGDAHGTFAAADEMVTLCEEHGFALFGQWGRILRGWAKVIKTGREAGLREMEGAMSKAVDAGAGLLNCYWWSLLADALARLNRADDSRAATARSLRLSNLSGERWLAEPSLH